MRQIRSLSTGRGRAPEGDKSSFTNPMLKRSKLKKEQEPEKNMEIDMMEPQVGIYQNGISTILWQLLERKVGHS